MIPDPVSPKTIQKQKECVLLTSVVTIIKFEESLIVFRSKFGNLTYLKHVAKTIYKCHCVNRCSAWIGFTVTDAVEKEGCVTIPFWEERVQEPHDRRFL